MIQNWQVNSNSAHCVPTSMLHTRYVDAAWQANDVALGHITCMQVRLLYDHNSAIPGKSAIGIMLCKRQESVGVAVSSVSHARSATRIAISHVQILYSSRTTAIKNTPHHLTRTPHDGDNPVIERLPCHGITNSPRVRSPSMPQMPDRDVASI